MHRVIFFFLVPINDDSSEGFVSRRFSLIRNCRNLDQHNLYTCFIGTTRHKYSIYIYARQLILYGNR